MIKAKKLIYDRDLLQDVDVCIIARHQKNKPNLGISRSIQGLIDVLNSLNLKVCIITEGSMIEVLVINEGLIELSVPKEEGLVKAMWKVKVPHPIAAWNLSLENELEFSGPVIAPIVSLQSSVFGRPFMRHAIKIVTLHSPYSQKNPLGALYFYLQRKSLYPADLTVANSNTIAKKFNLEKSQYLIEIPHFICGTRELNGVTKRENDCLQFVWIGSLSFRKGIDRLIRLIVLNNKRTSIHVVWTGTKFSYIYEFILKFLNFVGLTTLHTNLNQTQLDEIILNSDGFLSTSRFESFGMAIVEAGLNGKALIGIPAPGVTETLPVSSGGAIYFKKISELNRFIHRIEVEELSRRGQLASKFCQNKYGLEKVSKKWSQVFDLI